MTAIPGRKLFPSADEPPLTRAQFVERLASRNGFLRIAPNTLLHTDPRDVVSVHLRPGLVIIAADGPEVIPSWDIIQIRADADQPDSHFWNGVLQTVLAKF